MKRIISNVLVLSICLAPLSVSLTAKPSWAQTYSQQEQAEQLLQAIQQIKQGKHQQALKKLQQVLTITRKNGDRKLEATTLTGIGFVYNSIGQLQEALKYYNQALPISREVGDRPGEATTLNNIGEVYNSIGQPQSALKYLNQALPISREVGDRPGEATSLNNIGLVYDSIGQPQSALKYYNQALPISREVGDRPGEAGTLNNIAAVYYSIGQPQSALKYLNQALPIRREVGDRPGEATTLNNIGWVYRRIGQPQEALKYLNQALPISREVGNRPGEATTLSNLGWVYQDIKKPDKAIEHWEQSLEISLEMRGGLKRENRQKFLETVRGTTIGLADLLIKQNQLDRAYKWINRATTFNLANYARLNNVKVSDSEAQEALDLIKEKEQQLQSLHQQLEDEFSENLALRIRESEAELNKLREDTINQHPEIAELLESKPIDIDKFKQNIPKDTVIIQPVLLAGIENFPNTIAIFILSKNELKVIQKEIDSKQEFDKLVSQYRTQLEDRKQRGRLKTSKKLYDLLIRPVEEEIKGLSPQHLAIISTGNLRYIPFETFYDSQTDQYLIEKYPVHYLTRLSGHSWQLTPDRQNIQIAPLAIFSIVLLVLAIGGLSFCISRKKIVPILTSISILVIGGTVYLYIYKHNYPTLALANPHPTNEPLLGTEAEAKSLTKTHYASEAYLNEKATLDTFKNRALKFSFIHLGTHGCFQSDGCSKLGMEENTILFANKETYHIRDAALLGLENTELITLGACQTAIVANDEEQVGIAALAYIFERAGAKSVIASLWNAPDKASRDIMIQFYKNLKKGMNKSEALRQAKLTEIKRHPFFWSTFILIGDAN